MTRPIIHACIATFAMSMGSASAQDWNVDTRKADAQDHFRSPWSDGAHAREDAIERTLQRGADPLRSNFDRFQFGVTNPNRDGVQNYGSQNYLNHYFGTDYFGNSYFPNQWYYQNRRFITPEGGLYQNPSDRFFTR